MTLRLIRRFPAVKLGFLVMVCSAIAGVICPGLPIALVNAEKIKPTIVKPVAVKPVTVKTVIQSQPISNPLIDYDRLAYSRFRPRQEN